MWFSVRNVKNKTIIGLKYIITCPNDDVIVKNKTIIGLKWSSKSNKWFVLPVKNKTIIGLKSVNLKLFLEKLG